jgi:CDP-4-dehydro-6-deoxyglucose reductase
MPRLLNLSRAARLVGVTRVALQKKIADGTLPAFEGMVTEDALLQAFPNVSLEDDSALEKMAQTKTIAYYARAAERLPSKEVLAVRLGELAKDLSDARAEAKRYGAIVDGLEDRLKAWDHAGADLQAASATLKAWLHEALQNSKDPAGLRTLTLRDSFLRILASHVKIQPSGREFFLDGADTVLEAALRAGACVDYGCSDGSCGRCKARVVAGELLEVRPHDYVLSENEKASGYALMCCNTAVSDVVVQAREAAAANDIPAQRVTASVKALTPLGDHVRLLHLKTPPNARLRFLAGQNVVLRIGESLAAELPIAGCPCDDGNLPFHVPEHLGNFFSEYVWHQLNVGDAVTVEGPRGSFVLRTDGASQRLLLIAFGIGFARMKGLMEQAVALDSVESIELYWIVAHERELYFANWPRAMEDALDNFRFTPLILKSNLETAGGHRQQRLDELLDGILAAQRDFAAADVYVAGPGSIVDTAAASLIRRGLPEARLAVGVTE